MSSNSSELKQRINGLQDTFPIHFHASLGALNDNMALGTHRGQKLLVIHVDVAGALVKAQSARWATAPVQCLAVPALRAVAKAAAVFAKAAERALRS